MALQPMPNTLPYWTNGPATDRRNLICGLLALLLAGPAQALEDVPEGTLRWLQGFDGNPPTPGFRVDGTVLLRSVDDIANIGINLSSGAITNSPTGAIRSEVGVSGNRFINGSVINQGLVQLDSPTTFGAAAARFENSGRFEVGPGARAQFTGSGGRFAQLAGEMNVGDSGFELYDGQFEFSGGVITGQPLLIRTAVKGPTNGQPFRPRLVGPNGSYEGPLAAGVHLRALSAIGLGGDTAVTLVGSGELVGHLETGFFSGGTVRLSMTAGTLWVRPAGQLTIGVPTVLTGNWFNEGLLQLGGDLTVNNGGGTATNRATVRVSPGRTLSFQGGFRHEAGDLSLLGGTLVAPGGIFLAVPVEELAGEIRGPVTNAAAVTLSQSMGGLRIVGAWANQPGARLRWVLSEPESEEPLLAVAGAHSVAGEGRVELESGFVPPLGARFPLLRHQVLTGQFEAITLPPLPAGLFWNLERRPDRWDLLVQDEPAPGQLAITRIESDYAVELTATPGASATLLQSSDLVTWAPVRTEAPFPGHLNFRAPAGDGAAQFFRAVVTP